MSQADRLRLAFAVLVGLWIVVRKTPVVRERVGGVEVPVERPGIIDKFLDFMDWYFTKGLAYLLAFAVVCWALEWAWGWFTFAVRTT